MGFPENAIEILFTSRSHSGNSIENFIQTQKYQDEFLSKDLQDALEAIFQVNFFDNRS